MFRLSENVGTSHICGLTVVDLVPSDLVERFGKPREGDGYKVSGMFFFTNDTGDVFTIYDWKVTTLYCGEDSMCPTPDEFWQDWDLHTFQIGGNNAKKLSLFMRWLAEELEKPRVPILQRTKAGDSARLLPVCIAGKYGYIDSKAREDVPVVVGG